MGVFGFLLEFIKKGGAVTPQVELSLLTMTQVCSREKMLTPNFADALKYFSLKYRSQKRDSDLNSIFLFRFKSNLVNLLEEHETGDSTVRFRDISIKILKPIERWMNANGNHVKTRINSSSSLALFAAKFIARYCAFVTNVLKWRKYCIDSKTK